jgi:hypothetical protein
MTGDLGKGVMSGLMSYGMGSALEGLGGGLPGADPAAQAATETTKGAAPFVQNAAEAAITKGPNLGLGATPGAISSGVADTTGAASPGLIGNLNAASNNLSSFGGPDGPGVGGILKNTFINNASRTTLPFLVGAAGSMGQEPAEIPKEPGRRELQRRYPEQFPIARQVVAPPPDYRPGIDPELITSSLWLQAAVCMATTPEAELLTQTLSLQ